MTPKNVTETNRLERALDATLSLLDRQVVDCEDLMVCKVDDVELTEYADEPMEVTGLLAGSAALVTRLGGRLGDSLLRYWVRIGVEQASREVPYRIGLEEVVSLGSGLRVRGHREGYLRRQEGNGPGTRRRLYELLGAEATGPEGMSFGRVIDVRLEPDREAEGRIRVIALIVGKGRPGSMLGYDRSPDQGPWLVNRCIRWLHRHTAQVPMEYVDVDWEAGRVLLSRAPDPLESA